MGATFAAMDATLAAVAVVEAAAGDARWSRSLWPPTRATSNGRGSSASRVRLRRHFNNVALAFIVFLRCHHRRRRRRISLRCHHRCHLCCCYYRRHCDGIIRILMSCISLRFVRQSPHRSWYNLSSPPVNLASLDFVVPCVTLLGPTSLLTLPCLI